MERKRSHLLVLSAAAALVGVCVGLLCLMAWRGEPLRVGTRFIAPKLCAAAGILCTGFIVVAGRRRAPAEWKLLIGKLALLGVSLGVVLFFAEWGTRLHLRNHQGTWSLGLLQKYRDGDRSIRVKASHPLADIVRLSTNTRLGYELMPNLDQDFGHRLLRTNGRGMRDSGEYEIEKPPGVLRIVGVGDSGMFGWGLDQDQDYLSLLELNLSRKESSRRVEVLNLGVPGYNTQQEVDMLRDRGLQYAPDIVIVGWNSTDYQLPFFMLEQRKFDGWTRSYLYTVTFFRDDPILKPAVMKVSDVDAEKADPGLLGYRGAEGVRKAVGELKGLAAEHGFKILFMGPMRSETVALFEELGVEFSDLHEALPPTEKNKADKVYFMHPRAGGHVTIAQHLQSLLEEKGWL